ncbi:hypothetical protein GJ496_005238 [Pomphorhynchus laevis]|nr:hypothetical protein GJ496_005238 [Pomphorhynchus laevis]
MLINYCKATKFSEYVNDKWYCQISSINELFAQNQIKSRTMSFMSRTSEKLTRVYPKCSRVDSSNFIPNIFWNVGCQLVALNHQTSDVGMQINSAMFESHQNCGYVLKPSFLRDENRHIDPNTYGGIDGVVPVQCSIQIISGQFLTGKRLAVYVQIDVFGISSDTIRHEFRTKLVADNYLLNRQFNESPFILRKISLPELAFIRFAALDEANHLLGQRVIPFRYLKQGYRHITLRTENNIPINLACIFCNIKKSIYISNQMKGFADALTEPTKHHDQFTLTSSVANGIHFNILDDYFTDLKAKMQSELTMSSLEKSMKYQKLICKQEKELRLLRIKHRKEQASVQHHHAVAIERICKEVQESINKPSTKQKLTDLIKRQEKEWGRLLQTQNVEQWGYYKLYIKNQMSVLRESIVDIQLSQIRDLDQRQDKEQKVLNNAQAKKSIEDTRMVMSDRKITSKAEKERKLKEINTENVKLFVEERRRLANKHNQETQRLQKIHQEEELKLVHLTNEILSLSEKSYDDIVCGKYLRSSCV